MSDITWSWVEMCGPGGLVPWYPSKHDVGTCFQQLFLQTPVLSVFAIMSAYYIGRQPTIRRHRRERLWPLRCRILFSFLLSAVPVVQTCLGIVYAYGVFRLIDYLSSAVEAFSWFVHTGFVLSLRYQSNFQGPVMIRVLWTLVLVLSVIDLRTHVIAGTEPTKMISQLSYGISICKVVLQLLYGISFIPWCKRRQSPQRHTQYTERSSLMSSSLHSSYQGFREDLDPGYLGVAMEDTSFFSKLFFVWVQPLMKKGLEGKLKTCDDLYDLPVHLNSSYLCIKLHSALNAVEDTTSGEIIYGTFTEPEPLPRRKLLQALHKCFGIQFYSIGILKLLSDLLGFAGPLLLNKLVEFIEDGSIEIKYGYLYAFGLFSTTLCSSLCITHFNFLMAQVGIKIRGAVISTVYRKTLYLSNASMTKFSVGEVVNFMSTDTDRIVNSCPSFHALWSIPFQIAVTFYLLYQQVQLAFLAGVLFTIILIPINKVIASKIGQMSSKLMKEKDSRVAGMAEILHGIRVLKMHVWEEHFLEKIFNIRQAELKQLKGRKYLDALCVYFWATTPVIISILTFATYSLMGKPLTAATVFTSMALLNMLIGPLNAFPWVLNGVTEAMVSIRRVQRFMDLPDLDLRKYFQTSAPGEDVVFELRDCEFHWTGSVVNEEESEVKKTPSQNQPLKKSRELKDTNRPKKGKSVVQVLEEEEPTASSQLSNNTFVLKNINLVIKKGELVGLVGPVGSGKSALLSALLGEIVKVNGDVWMKNLDGGCAFVTQKPWIQRGTMRDNILFGKSFDSSRYKAVLDACCLLQDIESLHGNDLVMIGEGGMTLSGGQRARVALARAVYQDKDVYILDDVLSAVDVHVGRHIFNKVICGLLKDKTRIFCTHNVHLLNVADTVIVMEDGRIVKAGPPSDILTDTDDFYASDTESIQSENFEISENPKKQKFIEDNEESRETGTVRLGVFFRYWKALGHLLALLIFMSMLLMQSSRNVTDWWLSYWVSATSNTTHNTTNTSVFLYLPDSYIYPNYSSKYFLSTYAILATMNTFFTLFRAFIFAYGGIHAARKIHDKLLKRILYSKTYFFDISPVGRILNRFSSDTYTVDDSLPFILNILLAQLFGLLGSLVITTYGLPWLCLVIAPLVPIYHWIQNTYRQSSRELKRLSSTTLSPVYSHFNETLLGLSTIRAFRSVSRFKRCNEDYLEINQKAQYSSQAASQWLGLRLQFVGVAIVTGVGLIAVLQHQFDVADPGLVGLAISYALSITGLLSGVVSAFTETEKEFIALERVGQYIDEVEIEELVGKSPPYAWPSQGVIHFQSVYLKYREHLAPSLNGISFETRPAEKIGVVGRTGAGKSSLVVALLRMVELSGGYICIDTVNIKDIGLQGLRSRLAVIPQDPFLYEGTIRDNIDPLNEYQDLEIWNALDKCHMKIYIERLGGLIAKVSASGGNFSQGQRQLLCLTRAVLHNAKIVCVDEATTSVDQDTDKQIQQTIRSSFRLSTVLTIAHRISTVMDSDRVLVLRDGEIIEFDSPQNLIMDKTSHFYQLAHQDTN